MSGLYARTASGRRSALLPPPARLTRSQVQYDDTQLDSPSQSPDLQSPSPPPNRRRGGRRPIAIPSVAGSSSSQELQDEDAADASEEDNDEDDDEPALFAPSHARGKHATGHFLEQPGHFDLVTAEYEQNNNLNLNLWDEDDDDSYEALNDISDDDDETQMFNEDEVKAIVAEEQLFFPIDGIYEFGSEFAGHDQDGHWSSTSEESDDLRDALPQRQVRFDEPPRSPVTVMGSLSPHLTRQLLPSAFPDSRNSNNTITSDLSDILSHAQHDPIQSTQGEVDHDPYDSDATVEDLPLEAYQSTPATLHRPSNPVEQSTATPRTSQDKGKRRLYTEPEEAASNLRTSQGNGRKKRRTNRAPPRGLLEVNGKPWATLDPTGKKLEIYPNSGPSLPSWLAKAIKDSEGSAGMASAAASPAALLDESDVSDAGSSPDFEDLALIDSIMNDSSTDIMWATSMDNQGHAIGQLEAFMPPPSSQNPEAMFHDLDGMSPSFSDVEDEADLPIDMSAFITFDGDSSDDGSEASMGMPLNTSGIFSDDFPHLTNSNVTSFRRNADPANAAVTHYSSFGDVASSTAIASMQIEMLQSPIHQNPLFQTPRPAQGHKRKLSGDSPLSSPYNGATPVVRVLRKLPKRRGPIMT